VIAVSGRHTHFEVLPAREVMVRPTISAT
jgi:hypothetical protein